MAQPPISRPRLSDSENEKISPDASAEVTIANLPGPDEREVGADVKRVMEVRAEKLEVVGVGQGKSTTLAVLWMAVNTLATIGIVCFPTSSSVTHNANVLGRQVFANKALFSDATLKHAQLTFAAFHFTITWFVLFIMSRPQIGMFTSRRVAIVQLIPLAIAMSLNVMLTNLSLAYSTVTFYQVARILLTPTVAIMNFILYSSTLPRNAIFALVPACIGVGMVSYYDTRPSKDASIKTTSTLGVIFAFMGIFASSLYTVWISSYHKKLKMNSMQLLFNQAPLAAFLLLYIIPVTDTFPVWTEVHINKWILIMMVSSSSSRNSLCYPASSTPRFAFLASADIRPQSVRSLCLHDQHIPILHHYPDRPGE